MEYRKLNKLGIETSLLGFGCMRFPLLENGSIDEIEAEKMVDYAIANGVNYIDTAYPYHNGDSEPFTGKILNKYPRDSYYLATKLPMWKIDCLRDAKEVFKEQLERLDKDYIDFYLLHALNKSTFQKVKDYGIISYLEELKAAGKIKYIGFSFHDDYEVFEDIINHYPWDFCQIQLNYMDTQIQAGIKGQKLAEELGIPVIVMEPVKGGSLVEFSEDVNHLFYEVQPEKSIASWAIRYVGSMPNVKVILSGMSTMAQVEDNVSVCSEFEPLTITEEKVIDEVVIKLNSRIQNGCTGCRYCMPCPAGVDIPRNFSLWNTYHIYQNFKAISNNGVLNIPEEEQAKQCIGCGKCEQLCPQQISIREDLKKAQADFSNMIMRTE